MKQLFFLFGLSAMALPVAAQQQGSFQHNKDRFAVSVFANSHNIHLSQRADIGVKERLSAQFPKWYIQTDPWTGGFKELNGPAIATSGSSLEEKAKNLMDKELSVVGIHAAEWQLSGTQKDEKGCSYLYFTQNISGNQVAFSKLHFKFNPDAAVVRINMKAYGQVDPSLKPIISASSVMEVALSDLDGVVVNSQSVASEWEWFPIPSTKGYTLHPAFKFLVEGKTSAAGSIPLNMYGYVDAITGELLYRDNETKDAVDLKVVGSIYTDGYLNPSKLVGLPYISATVGLAVTLEADDTGLISSSILIPPTSFEVSLSGSWSEVHSAPDADAIPTFTSTVTTSTGTIDSFKTSSPSSSRHINAYYHVNTVHDFMKKLYGTLYTGMDYPLATNVDVTGTCNAFYTAAGGSSINFFPAGGGCISFAEVRDVVYHEYGHAIVSKMYVGGMKNGGLNEGQADVWGMSITGDSILARGSTGTAGSYIRRYDIDPKVFPFDLIGEVHADGEIIAGAWWDYGRNVKSVDSMSKLFSKTLLYDRPDGPNGTEGEVYYEMLLSALAQDDDDANLANGTPHFNEIVTAFAKHGIYLLQDIGLSHTELAHQPKLTPIPVTATLSISNPAFFQSLNLMYRTSRATGAVWNLVKMTDLGSSVFSAEIPAQPEGTIVDYYFSAVDLLSNEGIYFPENYYPTTRLPENRSNLYYQFGVGMTSKVLVDFESALGADWSLGLSTDNATSGKWVQAVPVSSITVGSISQTGSDHTSGTGQCLVTGNAPSTASPVYTASVKNGKTTVQTPMYDLSSYTNPIVEYYRWFGNDKGRNPKKENWRVQMSAGSPIILRDVDYTNQSDYQWRRRMFKPLDLFSGATKMQLIFTATETPYAGSSQNGLVEAAVDDFVIYEGLDELTGIAEQSHSLARIFPNPAMDALHVSLPENNMQSLSLKLYDLSGKLVSDIPTTKGTIQYNINLKGLAAGQYMLVVQMDKTIQTHKVTKQ